MNYRVHLGPTGPGCDTLREYKEVQRLIAGREWEQLQQSDQLIREMDLQRVFCGYQEERELCFLNDCFELHHEIFIYMFNLTYVNYGTLILIFTNIYS